MDLHSRLKQETLHIHSMIEKSPLLHKLISNTMTLNEYLFLIKKFYGFIAPCEAGFNHHFDNNLFSNRQKVPLLENDLIALGVHKSDHGAIARCTQLPALSDYLQVIGYLYVIEGSTLGGQVITRSIQNQLKLTPDSGGLYFYGYGKNTHIMWKDFCDSLNKITDDTQQAVISQSAILTFHSLHQWMLHS